MQKVDVVIGVLGAVALAVTLVGVLAFDELSGETEYTFLPTNETFSADAASVSAAPTDFLFEAPNNATGMSIVLDLVFSGRAIQGGNAQILIEVTGPNGNVTEMTDTWSFNPGATQGRHQTTMEASWLAMPENMMGPRNGFDATTVWGDNITVTVTVVPPADTPAVSSYSFTADLSGTINGYRHQVSTPDVEVQ